MEETIQIVLRDKQDEIWGYLEDKVHKEIFTGGGAGPGKSFIGCLWQITVREMYPETRGLIGRRKLTVLKESTMVTLFDLLNKMDRRKDRDWTYHSHDAKLTFSNGSTISFKDLDYFPSDPDFHRLGSTEYTDAFIDEAPEISEKAFDIINSRLRYKIHDYGLIPKCFMTGNAGDHWIKHKYVKGELKPYQVFVPMNIEDNPDEQFKDSYRDQLKKISNPYDRQRLLFGDWDAVEHTGTEFYFGYHPTENGTDRKYERGNLHCSFDQNYVPYNTCLIAQIKKEENIWNVYFIDEIALKPPKNSTGSVCDAIIEKYPKKIVDSIFYYGDSTSKKGNTLVEFKNDYDVIRLKLNEYITNASNRVYRNRSRIKRRDFINDIFLKKIPTIRIWVNEDNCPKLKSDLINCKVDADGGKLKTLVRDTKMKQSYQPYGHFGDALEYMITSVFRDEFKAYLKRNRF